MDISTNPWELNPELTKERLSSIAQLIVNVRYEALEDHDPSKGDDQWSYGCKCYKRCLYALTQKALTGEWPWFHAETINTLKAELKIGDTIVKYYKDSPEQAVVRRLTQAGNEVKQLSFMFEFETEPQLLWSFTIDTTAENEIISIHCVGQTLLGDIMCIWEIPFKPYIPTLINLNSPLSDAVDQPAPTVTIPDNGLEKECTNE